jgi:NAD(P)-dependent dehydrogenase (short-subunit alcohol dehydrogenase family)
MLEGQVALVTGCARLRGLGRGIALALAKAGADVAVTDLTSAGARNAGEQNDPEEAAWSGLPDLVAEIEKLGRRAVALEGDVGVAADADRMVTEAVGALGKIDVLVNNAGAPHGADRGWTWEVPEEAFDLVLRINTKGVFLMSAAVLRHLLGREAPGRIITIASDAARRGFPQRAAYCASKFGALALTQVMALEVADRGITVNAVCPGAMDTARQRARMARAGTDAPGAATAAPPATPVNRLGTPEDVARTVLFLAAPAADFITGQAINVDGGLLFN